MESLRTRGAENTQQYRVKKECSEKWYSEKKVINSYPLGIQENLGN